MTNPKDLQSVWHLFFAQFIVNKTILDVGAGQGLSKARFEANGNKVTTQDINRALMDCVDIVGEIYYIFDRYDVVTAFDVIEHIWSKPESFILRMSRIARESIILTTPNWHSYPRNWHYKPNEFLGFFNYMNFARLKLFKRFKGPNSDYVKEVLKDQFLLESGDYLGIMGIK